MNKTILKTDHLKAFYVLDVHGTQKVVKAVNDVNLDIQENEVYGIAGESGCGKTTLLKALVAAIEPPLRLMDGKILYQVNGKEIDVASLDQEAKRKLRWEYISYVPQGSMSVLNPVTKLKETYRDFIGSHVSGKSKDEAFEIAKEHLLDLGLPLKILDAYPHQLSGGMRQRVTIALATLLKPRIIIGDEPTTALDVVVQRGVVQLLKDIQGKLQNTIILVTHDMGVQANVADRVGIMYAGKIVEEAPTETIYGNPAHPYTQYLIDSLPKFGDKSTRKSVPGSPPDLGNLPSGCPFHPRCPHVMEICKQEMPGYTKLEPNHRVACWLVGEGERLS
ncbi:MAG TPA: ABC transporter ATP-binding protein [Chloroflexi bacterium]|nr:ABC transporter ATP-binding protein [Chloroflexota bacterium]